MTARSCAASLPVRELLSALVLIGAMAIVLSLELVF